MGEELEREYERLLAVAVDGDAPRAQREAAAKRLGEIAPQIAAERAARIAEPDEKG